MDFSATIRADAHSIGAELHAVVQRKHARTKHGDCAGAKRAPEYISWRNMLKRCHNENDTAWHNYGGRGIVVCAAWRESYAQFLADVGRKPSAGLTLDRIDVDGNYEPSNVRWADATTQANNTRRQKDPSWPLHGGKWADGWCGFKRKGRR
jgi:hypothetical protein